MIIDISGYELEKSISRKEAKAVHKDLPVNPDLSDHRDLSAKPDLSDHRDLLVG